MTKPELLLHEIAQAIFDKKGMNILALDVRGVSSMTDFFLIAEGSVGRHVQALEQEVEKTLAKHGLNPTRVEGMDGGEWVVIDCFDLIVHLFLPSVRGRYQIERLWQEAKIVDLELDASKVKAG